MQVALIGLPGAGVKTVFSAITELGAPGDGSPQSFGAHRIAVLQAGHLVQVGTPRTLMREPANDYVRQLLDTPRREAQLVESLLAREGL